MALLYEDLKPMKLYSSERKLHLPFNEKKIKEGSAIFLLTPDMESSYRTMNLPYFINNRKYESYYLEKDCTFIINQENCLVQKLSDKYAPILENVSKIDGYADVVIHEDELYQNRVSLDPGKRHYSIGLTSEERNVSVRGAGSIGLIDDNTFITSDLHFSKDQNHGRDYIDEFVKKINIKARPTDCLLLLGDIVDSEDRETDINTWKYFLSKLRLNNVILVLGNNDILSIEDYYNLGIQYVTDRIDMNGYTFTHYPENVNKGTINFCGHLHSSTKYWNVDPSNCINVGYKNNKNSGCVYTIGEFSKEICSGPHVNNTSELGTFKIKKEESSSAGVRRIKAVLI